MALQVWLPLDGDLRNQGLINLQPQIIGTTINNSGKIGKCFEFDGSDDRIYFTELNLSNQEMSGTCWVKLLSYKTYGFLFSLGDTTAANAQISVYVNHSSHKVAVNCNGSELTSNYVLPLNEWHHLCFTYKNKESKLYIDGELKYTGVNAGNYKSSHNLTIGARSDSASGGGTAFKYPGNMLLNDLRIYDHALSIKEVKELSKGLILHYRLTKPMPNLISEQILSTAPWNSAITSTGVYDNFPAKVVRNNTLYTKTSSGTTNLFPGINYENNTQYTLSLYWRDDLRTDTKNSSLHFRFIYTDGTKTDSVSPSHTIQEWTRLELTSTEGKTVEKITTTYGNGGNVPIAYMKLEKGNKATSWVPNESDPLYSTMGYDSNIELDCAPAGNQNDGTIVGTITAAADSPRYESSYYFDGVNSAIQVPYNATVFQTNFTINLWFKKTELGSKNYETLFGGPSGFEMDTRSNSSTTLSLYMASTRGGNVFSPFNFNEWYMVTLVNNGTNELYYINGELKKTIEKKSMPTGNYFIGAWSTSNKQNFKGYISDFRIYCTALSAEDIKELYNTAAQIDKDGNIYSYEFEENNNQNITKTGIMSGGLLEDTNVAKINKNDISLTTGGNNITIQAPIEGNGFYEY